jgi:hypothetical protein
MKRARNPAGRFYKVLQGTPQCSRVRPGGRRQRVMDFNGSVFVFCWIGGVVIAFLWIPNYGAN